jgi:hypothetical protein
MIKIAHRGNIDGRFEDQENNPNYLFRAIDLGYDVEVDVWILNHKMYFGHDKDENLHGPIDARVVLDMKDHAWFHCKNIEALEFFSNSNHDFKYFWHQEDDFTLTSNGYIWTYPGKQYGSRSILVDLKLESFPYEEYIYGVCTDWVSEL